MRVKKIPLIIIILTLPAWLSGFIHLYGEESEVYDLKTFLAHVESHSKDLKLARKESDLAKVNKKEATSTALPKIQIEANYRRNLKER